MAESSERALTPDEAHAASPRDPALMRYAGVCQPRRRGALTLFEEP